MNGQYQNFIEELPSLQPYRYENIFKLYQTEEGKFYFYNILKTIQSPKDLNNTIFDVAILPPSVPLTTLSYNLYGTTYLWWLICLINDIKTPFDPSLSGKSLKIIKREYIKPILDNIQQQLQ
jgi:hypothetical protein